MGPRPERHADDESELDAGEHGQRLHRERDAEEHAELGAGHGTASSNSSTRPGAARNDGTMAATATATLHGLATPPLR